MSDLAPSVSYKQTIGEVVDNRTQVSKSVLLLEGGFCKASGLVAECLELLLGLGM